MARHNPGGECLWGWAGSSPFLRHRLHGFVPPTKWPRVQKNAGPAISMLTGISPEACAL